MSGALSPRLQSLKNATRALIRAYGGQEAAEAETGKSQTQLSRYGSVDSDGFAPIDVVASLEAATHGQPGHPHVTRWLARNAGGVFVTLPKAAADGGDWHQAMGAVAKESGDVIQRVCAALVDGVSGDDIRRLRIREEIAEAQEKLALLDAMAAQAAGGW